MSEKPGYEKNQGKGKKEREKPGKTSTPEQQRRNLGKAAIEGAKKN